MSFNPHAGRISLLGVLVAFVLTGCGSSNGDIEDEESRSRRNDSASEQLVREFDGEGPRPRNSIFELLRRGDPETQLSVNRYIWRASLEVLDFLPVQSVDPFTGVIVTGFGAPPGGGRAYRATILIDDPALDARSLNVALQTRSGTANPATVRAVEDAILTRARQLRVADSRL